MQLDTSSLLDEWVAVTKDKVVAHGKDVRGLYLQLEKKYDLQNVLFFKVPGRCASLF